MKKMISLALLFLAYSAVMSAENLADSDASVRSKPEVDTLLNVPTVDYRQEWVQLGSFSVAADTPSQGAKQIHVVYAEPKTVAAYWNTGSFPDGAILVKDVFAGKTESMTTGTVSYADKLVGRFVMVRDGSDRNAGKSPLWGDGWGWAFYEQSETRNTVTTDYRKDCLACHEPARPNDLVYVQGYPILHKRNSSSRFHSSK